MPTFKTAKDAHTVLDYVSDQRKRELETGEKMSPAAWEVVQDFEDSQVNNKIWDAWDYQKKLPEDDPLKKEIRTKSMEELADKFPAAKRDIITRWDDLAERAATQNTIDEDPQKTAQFLRKRGWITRIKDGRVEKAREGDPSFRPHDPAGMDLFEVLDWGDEIMEFGAEAVATAGRTLGLIGAPVTGGKSVLIGSGLGAAALSATEVAKQQAGLALGTREQFDPEAVKEKAVEGAIGQVAGKALGFIPKATGRVFRRSTAISDDVDQILSSAGKIDIKPTREMLAKHADVKNRVQTLRELPEGVGNIDLIEEAEEVFRKVDETRDAIIATSKHADPESIGVEISDVIRNDIDDLLYDSEKTYRKLSQVYDQMGVSPDVTSIRDSIENIMSDEIRLLRLTPDQQGKLNDIQNILNKGVSMSEFSRLKSTVGEMIRDVAIDPAAGEQRKILGDVYWGMHGTRAARLAELEQLEPKLFRGISQELAKADSEYRAASEAVAHITTGKPKKGKGSPRGMISSFIDKTESGKIAKSLGASGERLGVLKESFPGTYELVRQERVQNLVKSSLIDGEISTRRVIKNIDKLTDKQKDFLFGDDRMAKVEALKNVLRALPKRVNTSGTSRAMGYMYGIGGTLGMVGGHQAFQDPMLTAIAAGATALAAPTANRASRRATYEFLLSKFSEKWGVRLGAIEQKGLSGAMGVGLIQALKERTPEDQPTMLPTPSLGGR